MFNLFYSILTPFKSVSYPPLPYSTLYFMLQDLFQGTGYFPAVLNCGPTSHWPSEGTCTNDRKLRVKGFSFWKEMFSLDSVFCGYSLIQLRELALITDFKSGFKTCMVNTMCVAYVCGCSDSVIFCDGFCM